MRVDELMYELPSELIARYPAAERDGARMLVLDGDAVSHREVRDLDALLAPGTLIVVNDTRVRPARLFATKAGSGGRVELLLVEELGGGPGGRRFTALAKSSRPLRAGTLLEIGSDLAARVVRRPNDEGLFEVDLKSASGASIEAALERVGHVPLPPYLGRGDEASDRERYQTLFARVPGAVAAPTAGLHFSEALLDRLARRGVERASITLHVGPGTFRPVSAADLDDHPMHAERMDVPEATAAAIAQARQRGAPVLAIGTTVVRALESAADPERPGHVRPWSGATRLLIQPGYRFSVVDALFTNFHLPRSTLLALVYAFGGTAQVAAAYREAIARRYRFYSYGDAMFLPRRAPERSGERTPTAPGHGRGRP